MKIIVTLTQELLQVKRVLKLVCLVLAAAPSFAAIKNSDTDKYTGLAYPPPIVWTPLKGYYFQGVAYLSWSSLQESNSSHFEIQLSTDGVNFSATGRVPAQSVSDRVMLYSFNDLKAAEGTNYYRVQYFDNDGHYQYSNTIVLNVLIKGINITSIYPGPFTDKVNVTVASETKAISRIMLYDNTGRMVASKETKLNKGITTLTVDRLEGLAKGIYIIKVQAGETSITQKLIK
ncbi:MAG TPA: T9SS type A sorting domain-containing protein [Ferruginibacter sp.]|nr:hypothetical protein [Chitinophagaceae bacterium]HRI23805.1 T9SS type A sorting domain-containing protein [Ferruginibacter sp.]